MKIFICDSCKKEFGGPLDEELIMDEHGVEHVFDLCAPCRKELHDGKNKVEKDLARKVLKK